MAARASASRGRVDAIPSRVRLLATVYAGLPRAAFSRQALSASSSASSAGERSAGEGADFELRRFAITSSSSGLGSHESESQMSQQRPSGAPGVESPKWSSSLRRRQLSPKLNDS